MTTSAHPIENFELFIAMRKIANIFFEELDAHQDNGVKADYQDPEANCMFHQTESGLFLEYYYGAPSSLWTPWGRWDFIINVSQSGLHSMDEILQKFNARLGAVVYTREQYCPSEGSYGPVYSLHKVDDLVLPEPRVRERLDFSEHSVVHAVWKRMAEKYSPKQFGHLSLPAPYFEDD